MNLIDDAEVAKLDEPRKVALQSFINAVLSFLIIATVVFFAVVVPLTALMKRLNLVPKEEPKPETRECPQCLSEIPLGARRCPQCTSELSPASGA